MHVVSYPSIKLEEKVLTVGDVKLMQWENKPPYPKTYWLLAKTQIEDPLVRENLVTKFKVRIELAITT